ncbi:retrovirus-related pol polyprotein from transposon TNT 1-94 [Tanacetum coccineum]|uniref:Retrovirus-related pol polyprotein from transposon TNT 1-94 n=1 Tax=Tanacetum coccineum TaxID=301880 RepID=A0ABQ5CKA8_9ASTR
MISIGQKNTLAEYMILSGADNRPPMLDKDLYDSWKSRMELYMQNREHGRMILESVKHGPLIWPTVEENGVIRTKKYAELSAAEKIQADCDMKATNIILQGLPADIYSLMNMEQFQVNTKFLNSLPPEWSKFVTDVKLVKALHTSNFDQLHAYLEQHELHANEVRFAVPVFSPGDNPIACLNKAMAFLTAVASSRFPTTNNQLRTSSNPRNQATIQDGRVTVQQVQGDNAKIIRYKPIRAMLQVQGEILQVGRKELLNATTAKEKAMLVEAQEAGQILDEEQLPFLAGSQNSSKALKKLKYPTSPSFDSVVKKGPLLCSLKKVVQIVLWYQDSGCSSQTHWKWNRSHSMNFVSKFYSVKDEELVMAPLIISSQLRFLKTKDEAPAAIIKCIKNIQVCLKATVQNVRTDNGTEFVNQTLREWRNPTLVEAARTMLIFSKAPLFLWAEAINTACYTQNSSLISLRYNKTSYELMQDKKPDLSFFHVFGSLCYPTNDHEDLGKFDAKADIGIFVGYAPAKKRSESTIEGPG